MSKAKPANKSGKTLFVKNPLAHSLALQISRRTGMTISDSVVSALQEKIQRAGKPIDWDRVDAAIARIKKLPVLDTRSADEILGYDEFGIPR